MNLEGYVSKSSLTPGRQSSLLPSTSSAYMLSNRKESFRCSTNAACIQKHSQAQVSGSFHRPWQGLTGQGPALGTGVSDASWRRDAAHGLQPLRKAGQGRAWTKGLAYVGFWRYKTESCT